MNRASLYILIIAKDYGKWIQTNINFDKRDSPQPDKKWYKLLIWIAMY
jgi:hypothetical protein